MIWSRNEISKYSCTNWHVKISGNVSTEQCVKSVWCCYCRCCHSRCWRQYWWGRSWCYIRETLRLMTTVVHTSVASPAVLSVELSLCWPQSARPGVWLSSAGRSRLLLTGSDTSSRSWLNVSSLLCNELYQLRTALILMKIQIKVYIIGLWCFCLSRRRHRESL